MTARLRGKIRRVYGVILFAALGFQMAFGVWAARHLAAQRQGASMKLWTVVGVITGLAAPLLAWELAGWRSGNSGLQEMRRQRRK